MQASASRRGPDRDPIVGTEIRPRAIDWLWQERIPRGMIATVAGKPDQGKGLFGCRVAADVTNGKATGRKENVLYAAIEDDHDAMTGPRLIAAGADMRRVKLWRFLLPEQQGRLEEIVIEDEISLIVIDPFAAILGQGVSRFSDKIRKVTTPLSELAEATGVSVLIIEHALKRAKKDSEPLAAIGGSGSGLPAASRMAYLFGKDPKADDQALLAPVKSNLRERPMSIAFEFDVAEIDTVTAAPYLIDQGEVTATASVLFETPDDATPGRNPSRRAKASEWLTRYLYDLEEPVKAGVVFQDAEDQAGFSKKTLRRAAKDLEVVKTPAGGGPNCTWALHDDLRQMLNEAAAEIAAEDGESK